MRILLNQLESQVEHLNKLTGSPQKPYTLQEDGHYKANIGNYFLDAAYGGHRLSQIVSDSDGVKDILGTGFVSKKELYYRIQAYIDGMKTVEKIYIDSGSEPLGAIMEGKNND